MADKELSVRLTADTRGFERGIGSSVDQLEKLEKQIQRAANRLQQLQSQMQLGQGDIAAMRLARPAGKDWWTDALRAREQQAKEIEKQLKANAQRETNFKRMQEEFTLMQLEEQCEALRKQALEEKRLSQEAERQAQLERESARNTEHLRAILARTRPELANISDKWTRIKITSKDVVGGLQQMNKWLNGSNSLARGLLGTLVRIVGAYVSVQSLGKMLNLSDTITSARNRLNYSNANTMGASAYDKDGGYSTAVFTKTQEAMDKMYASSQRVRTSYTDMMSAVGKMMALSGDAFANNTDNAIRFNEILTEAYTIGGATTQEISSSLGQLTQALAAGQLAGDELRSVREGAPLAYKAIEEYVKGVWEGTEHAKKSLKELGAEGLVTSEMVVQAILNEGEVIDNAFAKTEMQFGQLWNSIKNAGTKAFEPVSEMLSEMLTKAVDSGMIEKIEGFFARVSRVLMLTFTKIEQGVIWMSKNWETVRTVIISALTAIVGWMLFTKLISITCAIAQATAWLMANMAMLPVIGTIILIGVLLISLLLIFILWKTGVLSSCEAIAWALLMVGVVAFGVGLLIGSVPLMIVAAVIAAIALIIYYLDYFLAIVYSIGAFLYNLVIGLLDGIIAAFFDLFVNPIAGIIEWFVNAFNGGFNGILGACANAIGQLVARVLGGLKLITKAIDAIGGTSLTDKISGWQESMRNWGKNENAVTYTVEAPTVSSLAGKFGLNLPERIAYSDAWNKGMEHGSAAQDWMNNLGSGSQNWTLSKLGNNPLFSGIDSTLDTNNGYNDPAMYSPELIGRDPSKDVGNSWNPLSDDELKNTIDGIGNDTGKIADSMELTEEDLKYLRDVANMEWKKEFTTATIQVDMTNNNTITKEVDMDGFWVKLTDRLYEEMDSMANGVYAY